MKYYYPSFFYSLEYCSLYSVRFYNTPILVPMDSRSYLFARGRLYYYEVLPNGSYRVIDTSVILGSFEMLLQYLSNYGYIETRFKNHD